MGKRSNFERREADFYPTPRAAVAPLIPHLGGIRSFAEPCAGDGALVRHMEELGLRCVYSREPVQAPADACDIDGSLNCHGYGSSVAVTATFGMVAAGVAIELFDVASDRSATPGPI